MGVDRASAFALLDRAWSVLVGPVTLVLVVTYLTPEAQGFYFTFANVIALTIFLELGTSYVLTQFLSHEGAHIKLSPGGELVGPSLHINRFSSILWQASKWYLIVASLVIVIVGTLGSLFFRHQPSHDIVWQPAWWGLVAFTALGIFILPGMSAIDGLGLVSQTRLVRLIASILGSILVWTCLLMGYGLYSVLSAPLCNLALGTFFLFFFHGALMRQCSSQGRNDDRVDWQREIWPMQWRIALSWMGGYLISQLFSPVLFYFHGPAEAGRMGLSISISNSLSSIGTAFIGTKVPMFAHLIARKEYQRLDREFKKATFLACGIVACGGISTFVLLLVIMRQAPAYTNRILAPWQLGFMLLSSLVSCFIICLSLYLRAHKEEPFLTLSLVGGLMTGIGVFIGGMWFSSAGEVVAYLAIVTLVSLPWAMQIFRRYREQRHI